MPRSPGSTWHDSRRGDNGARDETEPGLAGGHHRRGPDRMARVRSRDRADRRGDHTRRQRGLRTLGASAPPSGPDLPLRRSSVRTTPSFRVGSGRTGCPSGSGPEGQGAGRDCGDGVHRGHTTGVRRTRRTGRLARRPRCHPHHVHRSGLPRRCRPRAVDCRDRRGARAPPGRRVALPRASSRPADHPCNRWPDDARCRRSRERSRRPRPWPGRPPTRRPPGCWSSGSTRWMPTGSGRSGLLCSATGTGAAISSTRWESDPRCGSSR